jgi:hypothetical protein
MNLHHIDEFHEILLKYGYNECMCGEYLYNRRYENHRTVNSMMMICCGKDGYISKIIYYRKDITVMYPTIDCLILLIICGEITLDNLCIIGMEVLPYEPGQTHMTKVNTTRIVSGEGRKALRCYVV